MAVNLYRGLNVVYQLVDLEEAMGEGKFQQIKSGEVGLEEGVDFDSFIVVIKFPDRMSAGDAIMHFSSMYDSDLAIIDCGKRPESSPAWIDVGFGDANSWHRIRSLGGRRIESQN